LNRRILLALAAGLVIVAVLLAVSGGFRVTAGGLRLSARSPIPATIGVFIALASWYFFARRSNAVALDLDEAFRLLERRSPIVTLSIAIASGLVAFLYATVAAAGADASGYLSEAKLLAEGQLAYRDTLASIVGGWQSGATSPLGWRPGVVEGWQSPTYPPGLPLLMALPHWAGGAAAASAVVAVSAAVAVWSTGIIASRLSGVAAIVAAVTLASLPAFIYQSVQPMSDVPVTAAWMVCWLILLRPAAGPPSLAMTQASYGEVAPKRPPAAKAELRPASAQDSAARRRDPRVSGPEEGTSASVFLAGVACALAVLIRPNLAPLAIVPLWFVATRVRHAVAFAFPVALAGLALMWAQWQWYGSPLRSGYGAMGELFAVTNIVPNALFHFGVLISTAPILLLAPIGALLVRRDRRAWALTAFAALVVAAYLIYAVFDHWSYFRFLLPALAVGSIFVGAAVARMAAGLPAPARAPVTLAVALAIAAIGIANARALDAFALKNQHHRVVQLGEHLNASIVADAVIVAGEQSGSMRYYTGRPIVRWEAVSPEELTRALIALRAANRPVWFVLDAWELEPFQAKFAGVRVVLDWPPAVTAGTTHRTSAWQLGDREKFQLGEQVPTSRLASP
jgi:hypothetical protein